MIATGGSVVYGQEAMDHLKQIGTAVYLKVSYQTLKRRLRNIRGRGVVLREGQTLRDLYEERVLLYEKYADLIIDEEQKDVGQTVELIVSAWEESNKLSGNA